MLGGSQVVLPRNAAWALAAAGGLIALLSVWCVILAWRAARRARRAVRLLEDLRRSVRRPPASVAPGPLGGQVPVMVPPETVFQPAAPPPEGPQPQAVAPPAEDKPAAPAQRPPPDISRYEVRLPGDPRPQPGVQPTPAPRPAPQPEAVPPGAVAPPAPPAEETPPPSVDETGILLQALQDPDPFVRAKALGGLAGRPGVDPAVISALGDDYPMVRREAVRALRLAQSPQSAQALVDVVSHDPSAEVREEAVSVLAELLQHGASEKS
ncbi:MAG TPA: HEAT repeat domain-containing protein [Actinomycetota bacterium]|nr:HEAT repeat domain-containing protein [Actinomycetota bacterium]